MRKLTESFNNGQRAVLESLAMGAPLAEVLERIVRFIESQSEGMLCSIVLIDDKQHIYHVCAPRLPQGYIQAIDGSPIGPRAGSCGAAAYFGEHIVVRDIETHPNWEPYRHLALPHGLLSCWSTPIFSPQGAVLGTLRARRASHDRS